MARSLPSRINGHLRRLAAEYDRTNPKLHDLIVASRVFVQEDTGYDNLDGGMYGHTVRLYVPLEALTKLWVDEQIDAQKQISGDLAKLFNASIDHEYIDAVLLEHEDENDLFCQQATPYSARTAPNPDRLRIWKEGHLRVFISHRNRHKVAAHDLASALEDFGFTCFVAHDTIPANEEWRRSIVNGLETMEVLLAFITDDFEESVWTMQEIGYALGKGVPVVSLKLEAKDPPGFTSEKQALRGSLADPRASARELFRLLAEAVGRKERIQAALVAAFVESQNFNEAIYRFDILSGIVDRLTDSQVQMIKDGYYKNDQLYRCAYLDNRYYRLADFLRRATGKEITIQGRTIVETQPAQG